MHNTEANLVPIRACAPSTHTPYRLTCAKSPFLQIWLVRYLSPALSLLLLLHYITRANAIPDVQRECKAFSPSPNILSQPAAVTRFGPTNPSVCFFCSLLMCKHGSLSTLLSHTSCCLVPSLLLPSFVNNNNHHYHSLIRGIA